jgi:predicted small secreted protein
MDTKRTIAVIVVVLVGSLILHGKNVDMNVQRFVAIVVVAVVAGVVLSGCADKKSAVAGIVAEPTKLTVGHRIRDFPVVTADGQQTSFVALREAIATVAFVSPSGPQCGWLNPRSRSVTVAQISEPTEKCTHGPGCVVTCNLRDPQLVSLCDADRIVWNAYHRPTPTR